MMRIVQTTKETVIGWLAALPNDPRTIKVTKSIGVCAAHWPPDVQLKKVQRHTYPAVPPIF